jgi:SbsC C-terminal domain
MNCIFKQLFKKGAGISLATTLLFTAVGSVEATTSYSNAESLVKQAESYAGSLKWAISIDGTGDGKTIPWKYYNGTKEAYLKAKNAVAILPSGTKKIELNNRLESKVNLYISTQPNKLGRAVTYIDAINAGKKIEKAKSALKAKLDANIINDDIEQLYHQLSWELKKQSYLLDRVYGQSTRDLIRDNFKKSAEQVKQQAIYPVSIKMALDQTKTYIDLQNLTSANQYLFESNALFVAGEQKGFLLPSSIIYKTLKERYTEYEKLVTSLGLEQVKLQSVFLRYGGNNGNQLIFEGNSISIFGLIDLYPLNSLEIRTTDIAKKIEVSVTRTINGEEVTEQLNNGNDKRDHSINFSDYDIFDLQDPRLKETDGFEGRTFKFTIKVTNSLGETKIHTASFGLGTYVYGSGFTNGTYISDFGYTVDVPGGYTLFDHEDVKSIYIPKDDVCLIDDPIEGTVICDPGGSITIEMLEPNIDLAELKSKALTMYDYPIEDVTQPLLDNEKYHVHAANSTGSINVYEMVAEIDGHLMKFNYSIDHNAEYVAEGIKRMISSLNFK